jgi:protein SMG9
MRPLKSHNPNDDQQSTRGKLATSTSPSLSLSPSPLTYTRQLTPTPTPTSGKLNLNTSNNNSNSNSTSVQTPTGITPSSSMHTVKEPVASSLAAKLATAPFMSHSVKVLDEAFGWHEGLAEFLQEQSDFLVVGVLGKQGVGKSTLMSMLAGNRYHDDERKFVFKSGARSSAAVQAFVSAERTIWLDVQPLLSAHVLERAVKSERKHVAHEFKYYENLTELQSIELACFLMAVCHVVVLVEDWFMDANLMRILQTAEMLAPSLQLLGAQDEFIERKPHLGRLFLFWRFYVSRSFCSFGFCSLCAE